MGDGTYDPNPTITQVISYDFHIGKYEITNVQFQAFVDDSGYSNSSYWTTNGWTWKGAIVAPPYWTVGNRGTAGASPNANLDTDNQPVVGVSWYEAVAFCNWLSLKEGLTVAYDSNGLVTLTATGYRLPTEVEWEYAAAKGSSSDAERIYAWGDTWDCNDAVSSVAPCSNTKTADAGSKSTAGDTPQGLADMSGNVYEWMSDNNQADGSVVGGTDRYYFVNDTTGQTFLLRGGAWNLTGGDFFRGSRRYNNNPHVRFIGVGFRVVRP